MLFILFLVVASLMIGFIFAVYLMRIKEFIFIDKNYIWSIGIYTGSSPFNLRSPSDIHNPVLTKSEVTDVNAAFVADPFIVREGERWYMFFEVLNTQVRRGEIAFASSEDGFRWKYEQVILKELFHLSYPFVFKWNGEYYLIPDSIRPLELRLYKALEFPQRWVFVKVLMKGLYNDPTLFSHNNKLWLFAQTNPRNQDQLSLYFAEDLLGPWQEHPQSPVLNNDLRHARPAGRIFELGGRLFRVAQDDEVFYGKEVNAFEILELSPTSYKEKKVLDNPIVAASGSGWNANGMHTVNAYQMNNGQWLAAVDGCLVKLKYKLK